MKNNVKINAIARLKRGDNLNEIAKSLKISVALVEEWRDGLEPKDLLSIELNSMAVTKAEEIITSPKLDNTDTLKNSLVDLALCITDEVKKGMHDHEIAKAINLSADSISKLQNSFFNKGLQIANINSNTTSDELETFKGLLRP